MISRRSILKCLIAAPFLKVGSLIKHLPKVGKKSEEVVNVVPMNIEGIPLPIIHQDFTFTTRTISVSRHTNWSTPVIYEET